MSNPTIQASKYVDPWRTIVESAERLSVELLASLERASRVTVDLHGVRGVPSSFFNIVLSSIVDRFGLVGLDRVDFLCDTATQTSVLERSMSSVRSGAA